MKRHHVRDRRNSHEIQQPFLVARRKSGVAQLCLVNEGAGELERNPRAAQGFIWVSLSGNERVDKNSVRGKNGGHGVVVAHDGVDAELMGALDRGLITNATINRDDELRLFFRMQLINGRDRNAVPFFFSMRKIKRDLLLIK